MYYIHICAFVCERTCVCVVLVVPTRIVIPEMFVLVGTFLIPIRENRL